MEIEPWVYFLLVILLISPIAKFILCLYGLAINLFCSSPVNLRKKYGDWAVITGCTDGVGKEYAKELARNNINVVLISRSLDKLNATKDEIRIINPKIEIKIIQTDFSKRDDDLSSIETQLKDIPVGILVNNVGKITECPMYFGETPREDLWDMININVSAATVMTHIVIDQMKKRGKGAIVNLSSLADMQPFPLFTIYAASKIYIRYLSDAIRSEYRKYGITVQCITPSYINTRMVAYSPLLRTNKIISPDASTYAKSCIRTLGRLDSTTGYWSHDIAKMLMLLAPVWFRRETFFFGNKRFRKEYFEDLKKNDVNK